MVRFFKVIDDALKGKHPPGMPLRQRDLAARLNCSQQVITTYRAGSSIPPNTKLASFAAALGYPIDDLRAIFEADRKLSEAELMAESDAYFVLFEKNRHGALSGDYANAGGERTMTVATAIPRQRIIAISEDELEALQTRIESLAVTVGMLQKRAGGSDYELLSPKLVAKRYKIGHSLVYEACVKGQVVAERRAVRGGTGWLITAADAHRWYLTFIRKQVNQ